MTRVTAESDCGHKNAQFTSPMPDSEGLMLVSFPPMVGLVRYRLFRVLKWSEFPFLRFRLALAHMKSRI